MWDNINDITNLSGQITNTYLLAIFVAAISVGLCFLIANLIKFEGGLSPKDRTKRQVWFYIIGVVGSLSFFIFHLFVVAKQITLPVIKSKLMLHYGISTIILFVVYFLIIFLLAKIFKKSKIGGIFPSK